MSAIEEFAERGHERVGIFTDRATGIVAIIAVHDTTLGPGLGGCRMRPYPTLDDALHDALGLSEGMTYKNSLAGLNLGGGKAVLVADRTLTVGREDLFLSFGRCVESMGGAYITAEDMGTTVADMEVIRRVTAHVSGRDPQCGGAGDPSPWTALGLFESMRVCLERVLGTTSFEGKRVVIQGAGAVGRYLAAHLKRAGAVLSFSDAREKALADACREFEADAVSIDEVYATPCDIFSPCAISNILTPDSIARLQCRIVAGAANTQLSTAEDEVRLVNRGILYAPDFVINSGGVILCAEEREPGGYTETRVRERVGRIPETLRRVLEESARVGELPGRTAVRLAKERIAQARRGS
ncbi:MAG: Glu/Leu/Phe/Val dehydrogenase [Bdellovibrionales bacterium]|nr:Glu/Leu/Phe/Val dehydrogenase [Bdellovibrionales bacterium]